MVRVIFLHPDLGIGGAERLVVDAAMALKQRGHNVSFLTNHHDPQHCFEETINGQLKVQTVGDWLPRHIMGRFYAACAYLRMLYLAFYAAFFLARREKIDVFFCDQISVCIPVLRFAVGHPRIVFYCHYPDQLLSVPEGRLKRLYRAPLDYFEELTVGMADTILVNSKFTRGVFHQTFRRLKVEPGVLYPSLNAQNFDDMQRDSKDFNVKHPNSDMPQVDPSKFIFFDINRYERKKNHELAIYAFQAILKLLSPAEQAQCQLVIAGGYDTQNAENCSHYEELHELVHKLQLTRQVVLLKSPKDNEKFMLLKAAGCVIYTPANEHFGIVPLEAMYMSKPVIAVNSGGPTETIVHNSTGILCEPEPKLFAAAMAKLLKDDKLRVDMGMKGHRRVQEEFSYKVFGDKLEQFILKSDARPKKIIIK